MSGRNRRISGHRLVVIGLLIVVGYGWFVSWVDRVVGRLVVRLRFVVTRVMRVGRAQLMVHFAG